MEGPSCNNRHGLLGIMDLNGTVTVIMDVFSRFKSLWTEMTHPHKFKNRVCTLLFGAPCAMLCRDGSEFLRLDNSCQPVG